MEISESRLLLQDAERLLLEIETIHNSSLNGDSAPPILKLKIKQFLENIDSALGYIAFNIFSKYCTVPEDKLEQHESKLYFPVRNNQKAYDQFMDRWYPGLREVNPKIISIIQKYQPYPEQSSWLSSLKYLVNKNKHRTLTKQTKRQSGYIGYMEDIMGNKFINCTFNNANSFLNINGIPFNPLQPNPYIKTFIGNIETFFVFSDINKLVLPTLNDIYAGSIGIMNDLEDVL